MAVSKWAQYDISNLGFASTICKQVSLGVNRLTLDCETGTIEKISGFGIIPDTSPERDLCENTPHTEFCENSFDNIAVQDELITKCIGYESCNIELWDDIRNITTNPP